LEGITVSEIRLDPKSSTLILEVEIDDPDLFNLLSKMDGDERNDFLSRAIKVGSIALQGSETRMRLDYVRGEFELMQKDVVSVLEMIFSEKGSLRHELDIYLGEDGKLKRQLDAHFGEESGEIYRLLDPDNESTPIGKFRKRLQEELDADREGTAFNKLTKVMDDGFQNVLIALGASEAAEKEREKGTAKGTDLEDYVYESLDSMARHFDDAVDDVRNVKGPLGLVGDVLIRINPRDSGGVECNIVVEVKNADITLSGKKSIFAELEAAKKNRDAHYAIAAVHESKIPDVCGCFRIYPSDHIVCSVSPDIDLLALEIAYKVARTELILSALREEVTLDPSQFKNKISEIERQLERLRSVRTGLTGATGKINDAKEGLKEMEDSIRETLSEILTMIRRGNSD